MAGKAVTSFGPRVIKPMGRAVDVRICPDACTAGGGMAAVASVPRQGTEFKALLKVAAEKVLVGSLLVRKC